jgi:hypothetical protein
MMHEEITESEITIKRTPKELIEWVESRIMTTDEETIRLRKDLAKQLIEEVYPLAIFALKKYGETQLVHIEPKIGNQNYDAILTDDSCSPTSIKYIEVTQSHEGETEHLRAVYLQEHGYVPLTGTIKKAGTKKTGLKVSAEFEAVSVTEEAQKELQKILDAILRKEGKSYPYNTYLVVAFDDGYMFRRAIDVTAIDKFVSDKLLGHSFYFDEVYLVGKKKEIFRQYQLIRHGGKTVRVMSK